MNRVFTMAFHIPGTLSADAAIKFVMPFGAQLIHVQGVATNDSDATLKVGTSADDDGYITAFTIGDSSTYQMIFGDAMDAQIVKKDGRPRVRDSSFRDDIVLNADRIFIQGEVEAQAHTGDPLVVVGHSIPGIYDPVAVLPGRFSRPGIAKDRNQDQRFHPANAGHAGPLSAQNIGVQGVTYHDHRRGR